jgi:hypothetical protein
MAATKYDLQVVGGLSLTLMGGLGLTADLTGLMVENRHLLPHQQRAQAGALIFEALIFSTGLVMLHLSRK